MDEEVKKAEPNSPDRLATIGPYHIVEKIGEGGMGEVYVAWHPEPVRRKVAIKVIKVGMNTKEVVARFESERQALALMDHPYIAKIFDGGVTGEGLPYFAMEYVPGVPITEYCDHNRLSTRDRLQLMQKVCEAVQHAHHKAIVHRDLKPSNILVSEQEGQLVPKVIDFGIAKALGDPLTDRTAHTQFGQFLGTPKYMSPEQIDPSSESVDTRSDVYSLGVILYELLVGQTPVDPGDSSTPPLDELVRRVREEEPELPSRRIRTMGALADGMARKRRTVADSLRTQLEGELDWITMRALEKKRSRRYSSPSELAADIERHLNDEVVLARPPGFGYRAGKFVRRHRASVTIMLLVFVSVAALAVTMTIQADRIARERDRANQEAATARQISEFLTNLFQLSDPMVAQGQLPTVREILDRGARRIETELSGQPSVRSRLQSTMALAYENLGLYAQAEALYDSALSSQTAATGAGSIEAITIKGSLGSLHRKQGRIQEAEEELRAVVDAKAALLGMEDPSTLLALGNLASLFLIQGRYTEAEEIYRSCLEKMRRVIGESDARTIGVANNLALALSGTGKNEEAEKLYLWVLETRQRSEGTDHPHTIGAAFNLAEHYAGLGRRDEAERIHMDVLERRLRVLGEDHPDTLMSVNSVGNVLLGKEDWARAEHFLRSAHEGRTRVLGARHSETLATGYSLSQLLMQQSRNDEARQIIEQSIQGWDELFGLNHPNTLIAKGGLARIYYSERNYGEAERIFREILEGWRRFGEAHPRALDTLFNLACVSALQGKRSQALGMLQEAVRLGYRNRSAFDDSDLDSLRSDAEFAKLVSAVESGTPNE